MTVPPVYIHGVGMASPLGLTAVTACAAMRAGVSRRRELFYVTDDAETVTGSFLEGLEGTGRSRWLALLVRAVRDATRGLEGNRWNELPVFVVLSSREESEILSPEFLAKTLSNEIGLKFRPEYIHVMTEGSFGGYRAILCARQLLMARRCSRVLVCAADSLVNAGALQWLSERRRLLTESNSDGVIPGEAAACLFMGLDRSGSVAAVYGVGRGYEPGLLSSDIPLRGDGVVMAAKEALAEAGMAIQQMSVRLSDAAGESYFFREQALAMTRLLRVRKERFPLYMAAQILGDTGAAAGLCNVVYFVCEELRGSSGTGLAIAYAGDDSGARAALIVGRS